MSSKLALLCLLVGYAFADLGQGYNNGNNQGGLGQGYNNGNNQGGLGQGYNNGNNQGQGTGYYGASSPSLGQGYNNNGGLGQGTNGGIGQGNLNQNNGYGGEGYSGLGRQSQNGYSGLGQPQSSQSNGGYYGQARQVQPSDYVVAAAPNSNQMQRNGYNAPYQNNYGSDNNAGLSPTPMNQGTVYYGRDKRSPNLGQDTQPVASGLGQSQQAVASGLGQSQRAVASGLGQVQGQSTAEALGQSEQPLASGLGQSSQAVASGLGQSQQVVATELGQSRQAVATSLGQSEQPVASELGQSVQAAGLDGVQPATLSQTPALDGQLRGKRYAEREPYRKACNTYYGKYICYRLYEKDAAIPNDFTCWSTYLGKQNCTETENVLYLDRRNVEVDPSELDRRFDHSDSTSDLNRRDRERQRGRAQDDEFGAVEKNLHNSRNNERQLPTDREDRVRHERPTQSSGARRLDSHVYDDREARRQN